VKLPDNGIGGRRTVVFDGKRGSNIDGRNLVFIHIISLLHAIEKL
jgi:hypothetical protein